MNQFAPKTRVRGLRRKLIGLSQPVPDLCVELRLIFVVVRERAVDLSERQLRMLKMYFLRTPSVGEFVQHNLSDFHFRAGDPGDTLAIISICVLKAAVTLHSWLQYTPTTSRQRRRNPPNIINAETLAIGALASLGRLKKDTVVYSIVRI